MKAINLQFNFQENSLEDTLKKFHRGGIVGSTAIIMVHFFVANKDEYTYQNYLIRNVTCIDICAFSVKVFSSSCSLFYLVIPITNPWGSDITGLSSAQLFHVSYLHPTRSPDMNKTCTLCNSKATLI